MFNLFRVLLAMAVTLVGTVSHSETGASPTAITIAVTRNGVVAGNLIVVVVTVDNAFTITNVSDGTTTNSTPDTSVNQTTLAQRAAIFSFPNHTGGNFTFTATFSGSADFRGIDVIELQGAATAAPLEGIATATGNSAAPASGNVSPSPTLNGEYIVGYAIGATALTSAGGFTDLVNDPTNTVSDLEGLAQSSAAAVGATWTMTSGQWGAMAASYKPVSAGGPVLNDHNFRRSTRGISSGVMRGAA